MTIVYLGKEYTQKEIEQAIQTFATEKISYRSSEMVEKEVATLLAAGKIVGWFQGKSEFGPRALGNRSILANPTYVEMKEILNEKVKFREFFRPFAPAILWENQEEYFDLAIKNPYMLIVEKTKKDKIGVIPAVNHVDNTGRIQTVCKDINPKFHSLIKEFSKVTGVPVILNTSFNIKGEPIVETPTDAILCFLGTEIDVLCLDNYLIFKKDML